MEDFWFGKRELLVLALIFILCSCTNLRVSPGRSAEKIVPEPVDLHYETIGQGKPLLLLHGFGSGIYVWRHMKARLAERYRVIMVDFKGFEESPKPDDGKYSIADQADLISRFIMEHGLEDLTIIGHSLGGVIALVAAAKMLEKKNRRIASLVLIDSVAYPQDLPFFIEWLRIPILGPLSLALLPDKWMAGLVLREAFYEDEKISSDIVELYAAPLKTEAGRRALIQTARQMIPGDIGAVTSLYKTVDIPTLILWCRQDRIVPLRMGERLHGEMRNSQLNVIEDCGHIPQEEKPEETAERILRFLRAG